MQDKLSEVTPERIAAGERRLVDLTNRLIDVINSHVESHPDVDPIDLVCDVFTASSKLFMEVRRTKTPPLSALRRLAEEMGIATVSANTKSQGNG